jgi:hypothetical protein
MKSLILSLTLGALVASPMFAPAATAQTEERAAAIRECMAMNKRYNTDPYGAAGGVQHMYGACMANHGEPR